MNFGFNYVEIALFPIISKSKWAITGLPQKNIIQIPGLSRAFQDIFLVFPGLWPALFQDFSRTFKQIPGLFQDFP